MNLSHKWLESLTPTGLSPVDMAEKLTAVGCAVEEIHPQADDTCLVAEITTNRPDWLGHIGVARELAAITGVAYREPQFTLTATGDDISKFVSIKVADPADCPRYNARLIRGVKVGPSPDWLVKRLQTIGLRPINNVVDITNYVMFEYNQPLHAFNFNCVKDGKIIIRRAKDGEKFIALDNSTHTLTSEQLVIADNERPVALAGVMGGQNSEIDASTTDVLLECAMFNPGLTRRTSRKLHIISDSSYRFERSVDIGNVDRVSCRAASLIAELAGGIVCAGVLDSAPDAGQSWQVTLRPSRCDKILGFHIDTDEMIGYLGNLGLTLLSQDHDALTFSIPSRRDDLRREIDLIEEVARLAGYDRIPTQLTMPMQAVHESPEVLASRAIRQVLPAANFAECRTDSFVPASWNSVAAVTVENPINASRPTLRTSLLPSLLEIRRINRLENNVKLFEIGRVYQGTTEKDHLALLSDLNSEHSTDILRGAVDAVLAKLRAVDRLIVKPQDPAATPEIFAPYSYAKLYLNDIECGCLGICSKEVIIRHDLDNPVVLLELELGAIAALPGEMRIFKPLPHLPSIRRDIAVLLPESVLWQEIEAIVWMSATHLESVSFDSIFRGKGVDSGYKSLAFRMILRDNQNSLTDAAANLSRDAVVAAIIAKWPDARLR